MYVIDKDGKVVFLSEEGLSRKSFDEIDSFNGALVATKNLTTKKAEERISEDTIQIAWKAPRPIDKNRKQYPYIEITGLGSCRLLPHDVAEKISYISKTELIISNSICRFCASKTDLQGIAFGDNYIEFECIEKSFSSSYNDEFFYNDGWIVKNAKFYNPTVLYVVFGYGEILDQLHLSLRSLFEIGKFSGEVIIGVDDNAIHVEKILNSLGIKKYRLIAYAPLDRLDMLGARVDLLSKDIMATFSPILYVDCDVIFDLDINEILQEIRKSKKILAQFEPWSDIRSSSSTGADLYQEFPFECSDYHGFNAGVIGVPSGARFKSIFASVAESLVIYSMNKGRDAMFYYEQSMLNFVFKRLNIVENASFVSCLPFTDHDRLNVIDATGIKHMFNTIDKVGDMRIYIDMCHNHKINTPEDRKDFFYQPAV